MQKMGLEIDTQTDENSMFTRHAIWRTVGQIKHFDKKCDTINRSKTRVFLKKNDTTSNKKNLKYAAHCIQEIYLAFIRMLGLP